MVIQGKVDAVVSARNGRAAARAWAEATGASTVSERTVRRGNRHSMTVTDFKRAGWTMSTLVQVNGLGHAWSGGGKDELFSDGKGSRRFADGVGVRGAPVRSLTLERIRHERRA
jgi:poly(3-hydroxybutyrate) depolymerase